jgi:hypothetical protein
VKYLALAWALAALLLFQDTRAVRDYLAMASSLGTRGAPVTTPFAQAFPSFAPDAQVWIRHSMALLEGEGPRLRYTHIDNAPIGREVHWNSAWAWTIAGAGKLHAAITGLPITRAVERASLWLNPLVLFAFIVLFSSWTLRKLGLMPAIFVVAAMALHARILEGFFPTYVDHHGLLAVSVLGTVLGAVAIVRGVRNAATFSALCGAFGLWVGASSVLPAIATTALAAAIVTPRDPGVAREWRRWGVTGAIASIAAYLLEYFPHHMGLRLEVNHPLYAVGWLAAGELIARRAAPVPLRAAQRMWPWIALAALPATLAIGGASVLSFTDPFMMRLHSAYITEFQPLAVRLTRLPPGTVLRIGVIEMLPLVAALATIGVLRRRSPRPLVFATLLCAPLVAMAWWQGRWQLNSSAACVVLALVTLETWAASHPPRMRGLLALLVVTVLVVPGGWDRYFKAQAAVAARNVHPAEAAMALARDIAAALRASQPGGEIILLASPDTSTTVGYYGRFPTIGTLYWENADGLKAAAAMLAAIDPAEAERLIRARRVTHVALVARENFIEEYYRLLHPASGPLDYQRTLAWRLLMGEAPPPWLQPIPYEVPRDLALFDEPIRLYAVR